MGGVLTERAGLVGQVSDVIAHPLPLIVCPLTRRITVARGRESLELVELRHDVNCKGS
jgi:hypothetical protein